MTFEELSHLTVQKEDAATAEVSRSQLWQWVHHKVSTAEGVRLDKNTILELLDEQHRALLQTAAEGHKFEIAQQFMREQITGEKYAGFLTE